MDQKAPINNTTTTHPPPSHPPTSTMQASPTLTGPSDPSDPLTPLLVDFSWRKFQALISPVSSPVSSPATPTYLVDFRLVRTPAIVLRAFSPSLPKLPSGGRKTINSHPDTIGTGTLHPVSVNASTFVRGQDAQLTATSKFKTAYSHLSRAYAPTNGGAPLTLNWSSASNFVTWDFICSDSRTGETIGRFSANNWQAKKVGKIEFLDIPSTVDPVELRDELATVGLVIFNLMILRMSNILAFFAAIFYMPGREAKKNKAKVQGEVVGAQEGGRWSGGVGQQKHTGADGVTAGAPHGGMPHGDGKGNDAWSDASDEEKWGARRIQEEKRDEAIETGTVAT